MHHFSAGGRVRTIDDLPLSGLIDKEISNLQTHRMDRRWRRRWFLPLLGSRPSHRGCFDEARAMLRRKPKPQVRYEPNATSPIE
jgi:hypothetical protein